MQSCRSGKNILKRAVGNSLISLPLFFATVPHAYAAPQVQTQGTLAGKVREYISEWMIQPAP